MKQILLLFLVFQLTILQAQEGLPFYEHYLVSDKYLINPSYAGSTDKLRMRASYRNQWGGIENAPNTQTLSAHSLIGSRLGGGLYAFNDTNGATSIRGLNLTLAYHIPVGDAYLREDGQFSFGLSFNGFSQVFDRDLWNARNPNDPLLQDNSYFLTYFNLGTSISIGGFYGGVSVLDIPLGDNAPIVNSIEPLPTWYYFLAGYKWNVAEGIQLEPSIVMNVNSNSERHLDINLMGRLAFDEEQGLSLGVSYRQDLDAIGNQGLSVSPLVKIDVGQLRIGYAYNFGLSEIANISTNGHLISIGFDFENPFDVYYR